MIFSPNLAGKDMIPFSLSDSTSILAYPRSKLVIQSKTATEQANTSGNQYDESKIASHPKSSPTTPTQAPAGLSEVKSEPEMT